MSNLNTNFENNDFDTYLNLDNDFTPVSTSPANNVVPSLAHQSSVASSSTLGSSQPSFSGPSYQYDSHRQQTGLPMGGLANTFAVNQASGLHYRPNNMGFVMPTETLNLPLSNLDDFDFGRSQYEMNDMDFDADSPSDLTSMYYPSSSSHIKSESTQSTPIQRIYPGMHSQQAAQAKQRQQEILRQQQQPKQIAGQLPLPTQAPKAAKDPHVEESISRLLSRMRQSSTSSSVDEGTPAPSSGMSGVSKLRKEEDDMDEDERLLASEEGKKLSSKERRQLRNKVSARAFRSRRKEYIGQLENEIAGKAQEANDLRVQNRQLMEENTRLTDLTRMLLSSQAFSGFLQELSNSGMTMPSLPSSQQVSQTQSQPQRQTRKDVSAHEASRQLQGQNQQHVGMTLIPETIVDVSDFSRGWDMTLPSNDFQVFSLTALPAPPSIDVIALCQQKIDGKFYSATPSKNVPQLSSLPPAIEPVTAPESAATDVNVPEEDSVDLYATGTSTLNMDESAESLIASLRKPETATAPVSCTESDGQVDLEVKLNDLCNVADKTCARLSNFLP